jgi:hypothetical protein
MLLIMKNTGRKIIKKRGYRYKIKETKLMIKQWNYSYNKFPLAFY